MTDSNDRDENEHEKHQDASPPGGLPPDSEILRISFAKERTADQEVVLEFPYAIQRRAVRVKQAPATGEPVETNELLVLSIPARDESGGNPEESALLTTMREWVIADPPADESLCMMMTLQGIRIFRAEGRIAILAHTDRLETIRGALIEAAYYESELKEIERTLGENWPQLEADIPLAFEFEARSMGKRKHLAKQFQCVMQIRERLARIAPHVHCPHLHPPTLASQVGERFRERTRMVHRHEYLGEQLEVFENVYEMCSERVTNFMLTRSGTTLEWVIIVLLAVQILLSGFDYLTSMGQ